MPYNVTKSKSGKYKVHYKKNGKMHTIPGASDSKEKAKKRIAAIEISKHTNESLVNEYNITLPSEESVIKKFEDPHSEEAAKVLAPYHLIGDDVEMAYQDAEGRLNNNSPVEGNNVGDKLKFFGVEHKGEQRHVRYSIAGSKMTLELIFTVGSTPEDTHYVESIISDESAEGSGDEGSVYREGMSFDDLFKVLMERE